MSPVYNRRNCILSMLLKWHEYIWPRWINLFHPWWIFSLLPDLLFIHCWRKEDCICYIEAAYTINWETSCEVKRRWAHLSWLLLGWVITNLATGSRAAAAGWSCRPTVAGGGWEQRGGPSHTFGPTGQNTEGVFRAETFNPSQVFPHWVKKLTL